MPSGTSIGTVADAGAARRGGRFARSPIHLLAAGCLATALAGCEAPNWLPPTSGTAKDTKSSSSSASRKPTVKTSSAARTKPAVPVKATAPATTTVPDAAASPNVVAPAETLPSATVLPREEPMRLSGLSEQELRSLLGAPTEIENRAPAKIWRYRKAQCGLAVSFYPDVQTRVYRILSYEVTGYDGTDQRKHQCWPELRAGTQPR